MAQRKDGFKMASKIIGVCFGWDGKPHLCFEDFKYYPDDIEKKLYPDYFINGQGWPIDPKSKKELPIAE